MPSHLHEVLLELFRNRPQLAPDVLRDALHIGLPAYRNARIEAADLTDIKPTEYRADLVVLLTQEKPVYGIIVEVQLARSERKLFAWRSELACAIPLPGLPARRDSERRCRALGGAARG